MRLKCQEESKESKLPKIKLPEYYEKELKTKFLLLSKRNLPAGRQGSIKIKPGDFYLVKTIEKINLPINLSAVIIPRTTTFRSGIFIRTGPIQPGYQGELTFGLKNEGSATVEIEMGARFVHVIFHEIKGGGSKYRGQWQGGRVSATKKEKQV